MKTKEIIIALVLGVGLSVSICVLTCNDHDVDNVDERPNKLTFAKYYEPCESNIEPNVPGYRLPLDLNNIVNISKINQVIEFNSISSLIQQNGFAIVEPETYSPLGSLRNGDCVRIYEPLGWFGLLPFVTNQHGALPLPHSV